jgi:uncharacterized repeat protein (TIGR03803 family)
MSARQETAQGNRRRSIISKRREMFHAAVRAGTESLCRTEPLESRFLLSGLTTVAPFSPFDLGAYPMSTLVADSAGNLYGTAEKAGPDNDGTVFEWVKATNSTTLVASFNGVNGANPNTGVVFDGKGDLFGTTYAGGAINAGTVFEILAGSNTITTLASFNGMSAANPMGSVALDQAGDLYGAAAGGNLDDGVLFSRSPTVATL